MHGIWVDGSRTALSRDKPHLRNPGWRTAKGDHDVLDVTIKVIDVVFLQTADASCEEVMTYSFEPARVMANGSQLF